MLRKQILAAIAALCALGLSSNASQALDGFNINSSTFNTKYNGNDIYDGTMFLNDWSTAGGTITPSLSGTTLTVANTVVDPNKNGWIQQDTGSSPWETIGAGSWTFETELTLTADDGVALWLDPSSSATGTVLFVGGNGVGNGGNGSESNQSISSESNVGANIFRVAYDSSINRIYSWKNGVLLSDAITPSNPGGGPRLILGDSSSGPTGITSDAFDVSYVRYDTTGAFSPTDDAGLVTLTINRNTGEISFANTSGTSIDNIIGYEIISNAGALTQSGWNKQTGSSQLASDNDQWTVVSTDAGNSTTLAEAVLTTTGDGDGGNLAASNGSWTFGNVWQKSHFEDVQVQLLLNDGTILNSGPDFALTYSGDAIDPADLDGSGSVDALDWVAFKNGYGTDVSGMTDFDAYRNGDVNLDGVTNQADFVAYRDLYAAAPQSAVFAGVPEPSTLCLALLSSLLLVRRKRHMNLQLKSHRQMSLAALVLAALASLTVTTTAEAQILVPIFNDDFQSYDTGDPADFTTGADNWVHNGLGSGANASRIFDSVNYGGTRLWIASAANAAAGSGINSKNGIAVTANTDYTFQAGLVAETFDPARTASGTYDLKVGTSLGTATSVIGGPKAFAARGDDAAGGEDTYADQYTTQAFNSGAVGGGDRLFITIAFDGTDASNPFVGVDNVSINGSAEIGVNVNTDTGAVTMFGDPTFAFDITSYSLTSAAGQLVPGNLNSLESQGVGQPAKIPDDGIGFEVLGTPEMNEIAEADLTGATTWNAATSYPLGAIFDTATSAANRDLAIHFTSADGETLMGSVNYVTGTLPGDFDGSGGVNGADFLFAQRNNPSVNIPIFQANYGSGTPATAFAGAVPEPGTGFLLMIGGALAGACSRRRQRVTPRESRSGNEESNGGMPPAFSRTTLLAPLAAIVLMASVSMAAYDERAYLMGDDDLEGTVTNGQPVGQGSGNVAPGSTLDSSGPSGAFLDITATGAVYTSGALAGSAHGAAFNGTNARLQTGISVNSPNDMWDSDAVYPAATSDNDNVDFFPGNAANNVTGNNYRLNYAGIFNRGIQVWAKPNLATTGVQQVLVADTNQHAIAITENNTWAMLFDQPDVVLDSGIAVSTTGQSNGAALNEVAANGYTHLMALSGAYVGIDGEPDTFDAQGVGSALGALFYVNGVATIGTDDVFYDPNGSELSIGSGQDSTDFYHGDLDDLRIFVWGDNSDTTETNANPMAVGTDYGTLNLGDTNEWIKTELAERGVTDAGDVNLDGSITAADVTAFVDDWRKVRLVAEVGGAQVIAGDWISRRDNSDLNYDGVTNLADAFILHSSLQSAGLGGLNFNLLGAAVPEPTTFALAILGLTTVTTSRRRRRSPSL